MGENHENGIAVEATSESVVTTTNGETAAVTNGISDSSEVLGESPKKIEIPKAKLGEINVTPFMRESIEKVAVAEGFVNFKIDVIHGSAIGDGFVGLIFRATIQEIESDKKLTVIVKTPPDNKARRDAFNSLEVFEREIKIYSEVLPAFAQFQQEKKIKQEMGFFNFPKCYLADYNVEKDDAIIIMEDLKATGFQLWDKFVPTNLEHAKLLFSALGRLHAVSFAMKTQKPEVFNNFKGLKDIMGPKMDEPAFKGMLHSMIDRALTTLDENDTRRRNKLLSLKEDLHGIMMQLVDSDRAEPFAVLGHGDCWSNNFMYKYRRGYPTDIVLLDWQITRYASPVLDLVYFIFACTDGDLRAKHYDELLSIYHRSLKDLLDHLGGDTMSQFPFTALLRQLKQFGKFGVIMATMLVPIITTRNEELPDFDFMAENMDNQDPEQMAEAMKSFTKSDDRFNLRMRAIIHDSVRYGYL